MINYFAELPLNFFRSYPTVFEICVRLVMNLLIPFTFLATIIAVICAVLYILYKRNIISTEMPKLSYLFFTSIVYLIAAGILLMFTFDKLDLSVAVLAYLLVLATFSTVQFCSALWYSIFKCIDTSMTYFKNRREEKP